MKSYEELLSENESLSTQFALLVSLVKEAAEADESKDFLGHDWHDKYYDKFATAECLAEIKAEAGRSGFIACAEWVGDSEYEIDKMLKAADEYAAKIRNGEIK